MSGIVGVLRKDGQPLEVSILKNMVSSLSHRGPDSSGYCVAGPMGLGQCQFRTLPETSSERQPLAGMNGSLLLVADARIDNREDLRACLGIRTPSSATSDSDLILASYEEWGEACPEHLLGDFSFAIWDSRLNRLFCARDPLGIKPFYYYDSSRVFLFASEEKALFSHPGVPIKRNEERIAYVLVGVPPPNNEITFFENVRRLPPAHRLVASPSTTNIQPHWKLDPSSEIVLKSDREYQERFLETFTSAVECRLRSSTPVGALLSGGLDSSSIAAVAGQLLSSQGGNRLHTFSAIFPDAPPEDKPKIDEQEFIEAVLSTGDYESHPIRADCLSPLFEMDRTLRHTDEPTLPTNLYLHLAAFKSAQANGIRVLLDGTGGDEVVSHGWNILDDYRRAGEWIRWGQEIHAIMRLYNIPFRKAISYYLLRPLVPDRVRRLRGNLHGTSWTARPPIHQYLRLLNPDFVRRTGLPDLVDAVGSGPSHSKQSVRASHLSTLSAPMYPDIFEFHDKASLAYSVEVRYPFWDRRLVEFCYGIPANQKFRKGWPRYILRKSMEGSLPKQVQWRLGKGQLFSNFRTRLIQYDSKPLERVWQDETGLLKNYYDLGALRETYQAYRANPVNATNQCQSLFTAVLMSKWLNLMNWEK